MLSRFSVRKPLTVFVAVVVVAVLGWISFGNMTTDLLPSMDLPYVVAITAYPGASPEEVEMVVTKPMEAAMATVSGIANITSTSNENSSSVVLEFNSGVNMDSAMLDLNAKIDLIQPNWPDAVGSPILMKLNPDMMPVMVAAVDHEGKDIYELSEMIENTIQPELEAVMGVASVSGTGLIEEQIDVTIEQELIDELNHIILLEVDKELAEVEDKLNDGEAKLQDAKRKLESEGKKGLKQLDSIIDQMQQGQENLPQTIAELQQQKAELEQQLTQVQQGIIVMKTQLSQINPELSISKEEREKLAALNAKIEENTLLLGELRQELNDVTAAIREIEQNSIPDETGDDGADGTGEGGAGEGGTGEGGTGEGGTGEGGAGEGGTGEGGTGEGGAGEGGTDEGGTGEGGTGEGGAGEGGTGEGGAGEGGAGEGGTVEGTAGNGVTGEGGAVEGTAGNGVTGEGGTVEGTAGNGVMSEGGAGEGGDVEDKSVDPQTTQPAQTNDDEIEKKSDSDDQSKQKDPKTEEKSVDPQMMAFVRSALADDTNLEKLKLRQQEIEQRISELEADNETIKTSLEYVDLTSRGAVVDGRTQLEQQLAQAEEAEPQLVGGIAQMTEMIAKLEQGILPAGLIEGMDQDTPFDVAIDTLTDQRKEVQSMLSKASAQIKEAQTELGKARKEFEEKREEAFENAKLDGVITLQMISGLLGAQNFQMPAGYVNEDGQEYLVRVGNKFTELDEMGDMLLFTMDLDTLKEVRLQDVASVKITDNSGDTYAKLNGNDGVILTFQKQSTFSTAEVSKDIQAKFAEMSAKDEGLRITPLMDQGIYIDMIVDSVLQNLVQGAILAVLILLIFLGDYRPTLIIAMSIPISVVTAFVTMYFTGITLNVMSLAGLALGVGMLVDNSIVVIENIYRLHDDGMPLLKACVTGAKQMSSAIFSSTLTTICVFLPIVFVTGLARDLFQDMGLTIAYSLIASLIVALTLVPAMSSSLLKKSKPRKHRIFGAIQRFYVKTLKGALRVKWLVLGAATLLLVWTVMQVSSMGTSFIPEVDSQQMSATLTVPDDYTFDETNELSSQVLDKLMNVEHVEAVGVFNNNGGSGGMMGGMMGGGSSSSVTFYITVSEDKTMRNTEIARLMQKEVAPLNVDMAISTSNMDISMMYGDGIQVKVTGAEIDTLRKVTNDVAAMMEQVPGTAEVSNGQEKVVPELKIVVDKEAAISEGLTVAQIYQFLAGKLADGMEVTEVTMENKDYPVIAIDGKSLNLTRQDLSNLTIDVTKGDETNKIRLGDVCDFTEVDSLASISRESQRRKLTASCTIADGHNIGIVGRELQEKIDAYQLPDGYAITMSGENEAINSTLGDLMYMVLIAIGLIYLIMVAQFQSFRSPFIVMFTIPLAFTGGLLALLLMNMEISMVAMLGFLMLSGVIVNNGIVFVDSINQLRIEKGMSKRDAIIETGTVRLRPILMTTLTTVLGMSTMAMASGMGAEMMQPMAVVVIGGLIYATLMTLLVVPILYDLFGQKKMKDRTKEIDRGIEGELTPEEESAMEPVTNEMSIQEMLNEIKKLD
ncbi:efflux RND transporter permease subunit [Eubacteriales bacterium OttesenSCG-928-N13]|nr:efflux RND transporter permease subunit [Eubacteriales bacterium OttesenSCG-928-N13]